MKNSKFVSPSHHSKTRPGTQPNHPGEKLVNILQIETGIVERVRLSVAQERVASGKWKFTPKK